jgi:hypothetical protein
MIPVTTEYITSFNGTEPNDEDVQHALDIAKAGSICVKLSWYGSDVRLKSVIITETMTVADVKMVISFAK